MSLTNLNEILKKAQEQKYAVCAFNIENMEMAQAVIRGAEELDSPVILQTTPSTLRYANPELYFATVRVLAEKSKIPVVMHLDHGNSFELASRAYRAGYTSIMIDGSARPFEENVSLTKSVVDMCHPSGVSVEAELGCIGGKEDDLSAENVYTVAEEAKQFVKETKVDALAVAIGTAHGIYKNKPSINIERLKEIRTVVDIPLVLHGTSGVSDEVVKECIKNGICKVNYATDLRIAFTNGVTRTFEEDENVFDPKKYMGKGRDEVKEYVMARIQMCGSVGKR